MNTTINEQQLSKTAYVYVRQSTLAQVRHHQESTERQYALKEKALQLGWNDSTVQILDRDLGKSGAQITGREDFKTLVAEVSMGQVGAVFALEVSRLARSNLDWHRLLELCALTDTLVIDEDGCYNPADFNDGLLLGLKGTHRLRRLGWKVGEMAPFYYLCWLGIVQEAKSKHVQCLAHVTSFADRGHHGPGDPF